MKLSPSGVWSWTAWSRFDAGPILRRTAAGLLLADLILGQTTLQAQESRDASQEAKSASVRLFIEDVLGQSLAQPAVIYSEGDSELEKPIAKATSTEEPLLVPAGRYWVLSASDESLGKLVTLKPGESTDVTVKVERGLWLSFNPGKEKPPDKVLLVLRPKAELEQWLYWARLAEDDEFAARRPEATDEALETARKLALTALREKPKSPNPAKPEAPRLLGFNTITEIDRIALLRILGVAGKLEDVDELLKLMPADHRRDITASLIGLIEARHDVLEKGRLMAMVREKDATWALPAAKALNRFGLAVGQDVLRAQVVAQKEMWRATSAAYLLNTEDPETVKTMRDFLRAGLDVPKTPFISIPVYRYLLIFGTREDWKLVASVPFEKADALFGLACLAQNPRTLIGYGFDILNTFGLPKTLREMSDRDAEEIASLRDWSNDAIAEVSRKKGENANNTRSTAVVLESCWFPHADAVRFYYGFNKQRISDSLADTPRSIAELITWFPYPESVDLFVKEWFDVKTGFRPRYLPQLEYVPLPKIEDGVKRLGEGRVPPGYELYCAYHRIAHRQRFVPDYLPMGERRWPYVLAYRERNASGGEEFGGGISGVASLKAAWRDKTLLLRVKLDQRAHYEGGGAMFGIGDRDSVTEYPHHRYMLEHGRPLIDSVVVRRGSRRFVATDTKETDGNWMLFEAPLDSSSLADLWVDVNLKFIDQSITLTESLFAGAPANLMRRMRYEAANSKEQKPASTGGEP